MKYIRCFALSLILISLLTGCGVSQTEYDALVEQNQLYEQVISSLTEQVESLSAENDSLSAKNDSLSSEVKSLTEYKANQVNKELDKASGIAWATTSFGDNTLCFSDDENIYLQCISDKTYSISNSGISELWDDVLNSASLLVYMQDAYPDQIIYETISVKFFDPSGVFILDLSLKLENDSYMLNSISCNVQYADTIISALNFWSN